MNALPLLLVLLAQETGGGAAPLLEKGERLFRQGDTAGEGGGFGQGGRVLGRLHGNRSLPIQNFFEPFLRATFRSPCCHRDPLPPNPARRSLQRLKETEQCCGIHFAVRATGESRFVAGLLHQIGEMAV